MDTRVDSGLVEVWADGDHDGVVNMARDEGLLVEADRGKIVARVYGWTEPWVTLGRFQQPERALLPSNTVPYTIRPTGGKAVLHGHDVTIGLAAPLASLGADGRRLSSVYRAVCGPLVAALCESGRNAVLAEETAFVRNAGLVADCFAHISPNDIVDPATGQKVCGCALKVTENSVLVQASVPCGKPFVDPAEVFAKPAQMSLGCAIDLDVLARALKLRLQLLA